MNSTTASSVEVEAIIYYYDSILCIFRVENSIAASFTLQYTASDRQAAQQ